MPPEAARNSAVSYGPIPYKRLSSRTPEIRLLEIQPTSNLNENVSCRIVNVPLSEEPVFVGLSALVGDPSVTEDIYVNHIKIPVPANLAEAIRHVRAVFLPASTAVNSSRAASVNSSELTDNDTEKSSQKSREHDGTLKPRRWLRNLFRPFKSTQTKPQPLRLWTDNLCINSRDALEAGDRVRLMEEAYRRAQTVVGWLGLKDETSDLVVETIDTIDAAMPKEFGSPQHRKEHPEHYAPRYVWMADMMHLWALPDGIQRLDQWPIYKSMSAFMARPFFQRGWIMTEISKATFPTFLLGKSIISWAQILRMNRATEELVDNGADMFPESFRDQLNFFPLNTIFTLLDGFETQAKTNSVATTPYAASPVYGVGKH
ncbi:putative Heterokaryon incompatibility protein 6, OR allele [Seiridium cardinale]|uniref:Heterokaryon incompatibility protein 6, OR allele n=1 Tax=Seiridium cardinale TaxID=138064 RepID=A0ABR2XFI2_9PEZI